MAIFQFTHGTFYFALLLLVHVEAEPHAQQQVPYYKDLTLKALTVGALSVRLLLCVNYTSVRTS